MYTVSLAFFSRTASFWDRILRSSHSFTAARLPNPAAGDM